jgi:hypothetical protein
MLKAIGEEGLGQGEDQAPHDGRGGDEANLLENDGVHARLP